MNSILICFKRNRAVPRHYMDCPAWRIKSNRRLTTNSKPLATPNPLATEVQTFVSCVFIENMDDLYEAFMWESNTVLPNSQPQAFWPTYCQTRGKPNAVTLQSAKAPQKCHRNSQQIARNRGSGEAESIFLPLSLSISLDKRPRIDKSSFWPTFILV